MKLTPVQERAPLALEKEQVLVGAKHVARKIWPDSPSWKHHYNSGGYGAPMAMNAGRVLFRMHEHGLVRRNRTACNYTWGISEKGRRALDEVRRTAAWDDGDETP